MKLIKDNIIKDVPTHLVSIYLGMGWAEYKQVQEVKPFEFKKHTDKPVEKNKNKEK